MGIYLHHTALIFIKALSFLDDPSLDWKAIITGLTIAQFAFENYLSYRQYQVLKKTSPPPSLKAEISQETFNKSQEYSRAKARFGFFTRGFGLVQNLLTIKYDIIPKLWNASGFVMQKLAPILPKAMSGIITQSYFFMHVTLVSQLLFSLPLEYYSQFVLEEKYGFNKLTIGLWITDTIKSLLLSMTFGPAIAVGFLKIIDYYGDSFIFYTCGFVLFVQLVGMTIFPLFIQPLFNKFSPLEDGELKTAIEKLASEQEFPLTKLYVIDGSKRSSHSNAYFTGLPWSKQIVLYDTLINHSTVDETVAVLAHEIGHWKLSHLPQLLVFSQTHVFLCFLVFSGFIKNSSLFKSFGFFNVQPTIIGFTLFSDIFSPFECLSQFALNLLTRKNEYQADAYAKKFGYSEDLARALIKLLSENLSAMDADWLYSSYHHSHPILAERLNAIGYVSKEKIAPEPVDKKED